MKHYGLIFFSGLFILFQSAFVPAKELPATINPLLKFIPADTVFFSGNSQLVRLVDYPLLSFNPTFETPLSQGERDALGQAFSFFYELFLDFDATIRQSQLQTSRLKTDGVQQGNSILQSHYGLSEKFAEVIYTVGVTPVIKIALDNEQAFLDVFNKAAEKSAFPHRMERFANLEYRVYPLSDKHQFIVNIQTSQDGQKLATLALLSNTLTDKQKALIFGLVQPEQSIAATGKVQSIQQDNQYLPLSVSFLDFHALAKSLFQVKQNPWVDLFGDDKQIIANLQASECESDVLAIAREMPHMIAGYKQYQLKGQRVFMDFETLLELKNHNVKSELKNLRGFIPDYIRNGVQDNILAVGLGANLSQLSPLLVYITRAFKESTFQCAAFKKIQQDVAKLNPAMLALMFGVVDGVQGVSLALQDFSLAEQSDETSTKALSSRGSSRTLPQPLTLSLLMTLSAENPLQVWQMAAAFNPEIASLLPSDKPQKLNFPELKALGFDVFVALKGKHLVLYSGNKAEAISHTLVNEKLVSNGFIQESLNYEKFTQAVIALRNYLTLPANQNNLPAEACIYFDESIAMLSRFSGFVNFRSDFVSNGWLNVFNAEIELSPALKTEYQLAGNYETYSVQDGCLLAKDGYEQVLEDGTGFYQKYSDDGQCIIFETRYRWTQNDEQLNLQYVSEHSRPEGICANAFNDWTVPEADYVNDVCQLRASADGNFACLYQWDDVLTKAVYKRL